MYIFFTLQEECMLRYKYLVELVKKQKSDESSEPSPNNPSESADNQTPTDNGPSSLGKQQEDE